MIAILCLTMPYRSTKNKAIRDCLKIVESFKQIEKTIKANIKIAKEYKVRNKIHQIEKDFK